MAFVNGLPGRHRARACARVAQQHATQRRRPLLPSANPMPDITTHPRSIPGSALNRWTDGSASRLLIFTGGATASKHRFRGRAQSGGSSGPGSIVVLASLSLGLPVAVRWRGRVLGSSGEPQRQLPGVGSQFSARGVWLNALRVDRKRFQSPTLVFSCWEVQLACRALLVVLLSGVDGAFCRLLPWVALLVVLRSHGAPAAALGTRRYTPRPPEKSPINFWESNPSCQLVGCRAR